MEMSMHMTQTLDRTSDFRLLTDAEVDEVSGGLFWFALGFCSGLGIGIAVGVAIALW
jgi:hypothetical protein